MSKIIQDKYVRIPAFEKGAVYGVVPGIGLILLREVGISLSSRKKKKGKRASE